LKWGDLTVMRTLYIMLMLDFGTGNSGPPDRAMNYKMRLAAEPFFPKYLRAFGDKGGVLAWSVGCMISVPPFQCRTLQDLPFDPVTGARFLKMAVEAGDAEARSALADVTAGRIS
jgi:hypothetical protein